MSRKVLIAIDGGITNINFLKGSLKCMRFGVGLNMPITIKLAMPQALMAGICSHNWFEVDVDEADGPTLLSVKIINGNDVSCTFGPEGLPGYNIPPNSCVVLTYTRDANGCIDMNTEGL